MEERNYYQGCAGGIDPREIDNFDFKKSIYIAEQKYDGIYIQLKFDNEGKLTMISRNMKEKVNAQLDSLKKYLEHTFRLKNSVLVGELAFSTQSGTEYQAKWGHSKVDIFDVLLWEGMELHTKSLLQRKDILKNIFDSRECQNYNDRYGYYAGSYVVMSPYLKSSDFANFNHEVKTWFYQIVKDGGEGLVIKDTADTGYNFGDKSKLWYKIKKLVSMDYVIMGYVDSDSDKYGPKGWIKNIVCGLYENGKLTEKVKVGSMTEKNREYISKNKNNLLGTVIEVKGFEIFKSGSIRHPSFERFREDKDAVDCIWGEQVIA